VNQRERVRELASSEHAERSFQDLLVLLVFIGLVIFGLGWFAGAGVVWSALVGAEFVLFVLAVRWIARRRRRRGELL
jgi:O-antigen/teichoic acid export membrane protein